MIVAKNLNYSNSEAVMKNSNRTCSAFGCPVVTSGLCKKHAAYMARRWAQENLRAAVIESEGYYTPETHAAYLRKIRMAAGGQACLLD